MAERLGRLARRAYDSQETARADKRLRDSAIVDAERLGWTAQQIAEACVTGKRRPGERRAPHLSIVHVRRILALMSVPDE
jgi:hypothetical protein